MAERKSGPVKPPIIDLTARPAETPTVAAGGATTAKPPVMATDPTTAPPAQKTAAKPEPPSGKAPGEDGKPTGPAISMSPPTGKPQDNNAARAEESTPKAKSPKSAAQGSIWAPAVAGGVGGAIVAIAVCYGLASFGLWPAGGDARLAALDSRLSAAEKSSAAANTGLGTLGTQLNALQTDTAAKLGAANSALTAMQASMGKLQAPSADFGAVRDQLKTLSARVDAVAAGASSADAGALAANIATVQQNLAALTQKVSALDDRAGGADSAIAALKTELETAKSAIDKAAAAAAPSPKTIATAMQLPLLISALDADFAAGRPFASDLKGLQSAIPEAHVPASVGAVAASGLPAAADVVTAFEAKMPDIIAARPAPTDTSWQAQAGDWLKGVLALRQQGPETGDGPDAVLSRLEAAVNRHDFAGASALFGQLPPPMQQAAGDVRGQVQALADADAFLADLRQKALAPAAGVEQ